MKINIPKEWLEKRARLEEGCEIGAGPMQRPGLETDDMNAPSKPDITDGVDTPDGGSSTDVS